MTKCDYCGSRIFLGGVKLGDLRYCSDTCRQGGTLMALARQVPVDVLQQRVDEVHAGPCPRCQGPGPVDVRNSFRVWSAILVTSWSTRVNICCRSCGLKRQLGDFVISFVFGWWGFPHGIIMTPIMLGKNLFAMLRPPDPAQPSPLLIKQVCLNIAAHLSTMPAPPNPSQPS